MNNHPKEPQSIKYLQTTTFINFLLISLMLTCFAIVLGNFFQIINPGFRALVFQSLSFFVALESLLLRNFQRKESRFSQNQVMGTVSEIIFIILITKFLTMLIAGFSTLWGQISSWQQDFWINFFDVNTLLNVGGILFIWMLTWVFSHPLTQLEEDHSLMAQEKLGIVFTDRRKARRNLLNLIFILGFLMIILISMINYFIEIQLFIQINSKSFLPVLLLYFAAGFVFLSINQYAIMKTYWYLNEIPVNSDLTKRWILYTILFIIFVIFIIIFLPNDITLGFEPLLEIIAQIFLFLFSIFQFLIIFPIALVISLIASLFSDEPVENLIQDQVQEYIPAPPEISGSTPSWFAVIKSVLFWLVFILIIVFTIRFYFKNNNFLGSLVKNFRFVNWLKDFWKWIKEAILKIKRSTAASYKTGLKNISEYIRNRQIRLPKLAGSTRKMPPRQALIMTYLEWIQWNQQFGRERKKSETPLEYAQTYNQFYGESTTLVNTFTNVFIDARYSKHPINDAQVKEAKRLLAKLKETFEQNQENQVTNSEGRS